MKIRNCTKIAALCLGLTVAGFASDASRPWKFKAGIGVRSQTPLVVLGGFSYNNLDFRLQGLGLHNGPREYWCGVRGSLLWTFLENLPFQISAGIGGGYEYAQAPNDLHKAINDANNAYYLLPYNYKENLDVSGEIWTSIYGLYTQISVPIYQFRDHNVPRILWGAGYMVEF